MLLCGSRKTDPVLENLGDGRVVCNDLGRIGLLLRISLIVVNPVKRSVSLGGCGEVVYLIGGREAYFVLS